MSEKLIDEAYELLRFGLRQPKTSQIREIVLMEGARQLEFVVPAGRLVLFRKVLSGIFETYDSGDENKALDHLDHLVASLRVTKN